MRISLAKNLATRLGIATLAMSWLAASGGAVAANSEKPNILFIMGDDIGIMNVGAYHQGLMVGETPNIDRLADEGARFMTYYAEQSCTAGRTAFSTGMHPLRAGMVM
ncbi:MAG: sulfatase-like hydrolase/transferase, partial [Gammaproteobacteria bacterium]